jgi:hypothetical protein
MKCKNCGYNNNIIDKPKNNNKINKINKLIDLWKYYEFESYSGKLDIKIIWEELKNKLKIYKCSTPHNTISLITLLNILKKPPNNILINLIKELK